MTPITIRANSDKDAGDDQAFQPAPVHRPSIDEVGMPIPMDDQYEDYSDGGASSEAENETDKVILMTASCTDVPTYLICTL